MFRKIISLPVLLLFSLLSAQKEGVSSYNAININYKVNPHYFLYAEGQLRGIDDYSYPDYYELKAGVGYYLTKSHKPLIGVGRYVNYKKHTLDKEEFRIWLQDIIDVKKGSVKFKNRFRAEKSWFYRPKVDEHSERVRFRYRMTVSVPLNSKEVHPGTVSATAYDEVFFIPADDVWFTRHRLFGGMAYQIDDVFSILTGYLWQREFSASGNKNNHFVYLGLSLSLDATRSGERTVPDID